MTGMLALVVAMPDTRSSRGDRVAPRDPHRIFAYGTLRRAKSSAAPVPLFREHARFFAVGRLRGHIFDFGPYPGLLLANDGDYVEGELFELPATVFDTVIAELDRYEGCAVTDPPPHLYQRLVVGVDTQEGVVDAWAYVLVREP